MVAADTLAWRCSGCGAISTYRRRYRGSISLAILLAASPVVVAVILGYVAEMRDSSGWMLASLIALAMWLPAAVVVANLCTVHEPVTDPQDADAVRADERRNRILRALISFGYIAAGIGGLLGILRLVGHAD